MALVVEDGTGLSNADSFASLATALAYHASIGTAAWIAGGVTDPLREIALRKATAWVRDAHIGRWDGNLVLDTQALPFPRVGLTDAEWRTVSSTSVPIEVVEVTCDMAAIALSEDLMPDLAAGSGAVMSESVSAGPVSSSTTYGAGGSREQKKYVRASARLSQFMLEVAGRRGRG